MSDNGGDFSQRGNASHGDVDASALTTEFGLLANQRRLLALICLRQSQSPMGLDELVDEVAKREYGGDPESVPETIRERAELSLYHVHIPKLREAGIVRYDSDRENVSLSENAENIESVIDAVFED